MRLRGGKCNSCIRCIRYDAPQPGKHPRRDPVPQLKPRQREAVLERMLADEDISADMADTLELEARRHQPRQPLRQVLKELGIKA